MFMNLLKVGEELARGEKEFKEREKESKMKFDKEFAEMKREFKEMEANTNIGSFDNFLYSFRFGK